MEQRIKIMNPEKAKSIDDVDAKVTQWRSDIRVLRESRQKQDLEMVGNDDQMITILIGMLPDSLSDHLVTKYTPGATKFDDLIVVMITVLQYAEDRAAERAAKRQRGEDASEATQTDSERTVVDHDGIS